MTAQQTTSLAEFLLARFAKDEAAAELSETHGSGRFPVASWMQLFNGIGQDPVMHASRLRAEVQAKRQLVQRSLDVIASFGDWDAAEAIAAGGRKLWGDVNRRERSHAHDTLRLLAAPYADHEGYRSEWAP